MGFPKVGISKESEDLAEPEDDFLFKMIWEKYIAF